MHLIASIQTVSMKLNQGASIGSVERNSILNRKPRNYMRMIIVLSRRVCKSDIGKSTYRQLLRSGSTRVSSELRMRVVKVMKGRGGRMG